MARSAIWAGTSPAPTRALLANETFERRRDRRVDIPDEHQEQANHKQQRIILPQPGLCRAKDDRAGARDPAARIPRPVNHPRTPPATDECADARQPARAIDAAINDVGIDAPEG